MAFVEGTQILTNSGWKNIGDISGHDKVLVRNFLGDAEFIQPFAIKKKQYTGEVITVGAKDWNFTVTTDHRVVYEKSKKVKGTNMKSVPAKDLKIHLHHRIYRKFRYIFPDEPKREYVTIRDDFGRRRVIISNYDWYKLVAYVLCRGFIRMKPGRPMLMFLVSEEKADKELADIRDILDRIGVSWHIQHSDKTRIKLVVSSKNTLAQRLINRLGSSVRKEMFLPDKIIYNSSKELAKLLIMTIIEISTNPDTKNSICQISTSNKKLIDSLSMLCMLSGYSVHSTLKSRVGDFTGKGIAKKDSYTFRIFKSPDTYSPRYIKKSNYSGFVYEIDLFEGQVYVKGGTMPVWVNPK